MAIPVIYGFEVVHVHEDDGHTTASTLDKFPDRLFKIPVTETSCEGIPVNLVSEVLLLLAHFEQGHLHLGIALFLVHIFGFQ